MLVVLAGLWLGPRAGAASMLLFLTAGAAGLPVFSPMGPPGFARLLGPTGGFLLAYPVAAYVAGLVSSRTASFAGRLLASFLGFAVLFAGGLTQLAVLTGSAERAIATGLLPFLLPDSVKAVAAALLAPRLPRSAER